VHKGQLNLYFYPCINFKTHPIHYTGDNQTNKACSFLQKEQSLEKLHAPHVDHSALQELVYSCTLVTSIQLKCTGVLLINLQRAETLTTVIRPLKQDQTLIYCSQCSNETKYTYSHCLTNSNRSDIHLGCIFYIYYLSAWQELFPRMKNNQCRSSPLWTHEPRNQIYVINAPEFHVIFVFATVPFVLPELPLYRLFC